MAQAENTGERSTGTYSEVTPAEAYGRAVFILGSVNDAPKIEAAADLIHSFDVDVDVRIASAHKHPRILLEVLYELKRSDQPTVVIAAVGRQPALGATVSANCAWPVITYLILEDNFKEVDIVSAVRLPSRVGALVAASPEQAALGAVAILGVTNPDLRFRLVKHRMESQLSIERGDSEARERFRQRYAGRSAS